MSKKGDTVWNWIRIHDKWKSFVKYTVHISTYDYADMCEECLKIYQEKFEL